MIRSRRQAHRLAFLVVGCLLATIWMAGLILRSEVPPLDSSFEDLARQSGFVVDGTNISIPVADEKFATLFQRDVDGASLLIRPLTPILKPDLLVYWVPSSETTLDSNLSERAILVGSLAGDSPRRLLLPRDAVQGEGDIVIYSLGHKEVVERFPVRSTISSTREMR